MSKAIANNIAVKGSTKIVGIKLAPIDGTYTFKQLKDANRIIAKYYIINTLTKYPITALYQVLPSNDANYNNVYAFTLDTTNLHCGVVMVELTITVPAHGNIPQRTEIIRCSTGITVVD